MNGELIAKDLSKKQCAEAGMALVLILLVIGYFTGNGLFYRIAIPVLLVNMIQPLAYYPFAIFWYTFSNILGFFVSRVILTVLFAVLVVPVGFMRRALGKDSLNLKKFKKGRSSILKTRNYTFSSEDIVNPY